MLRSSIRRAVPLLTLLTVAGCSCSEEGTTTPPASEPADEVVEAPAEPAAPDDSDYGQELARMTTRLEADARSAERYEGDWIRWEHVAAGYSERAGLTGDYDDYVRAQTTLEHAFSMAAEGSGPLLTRAHLHFTLHRLDQASADLDTMERAPLVLRTIPPQIEALRADIAFHRGEFDLAARMHREAEEASPTSSTAFHIAYDLWQRAQWPEAERWLSVAEGRVSPRDPRTRAWMNLQMGLMDLDRGRYDDALAHYERADEIFSGWWLVHEHIAEIYAAKGELEEAERRYRDVVERTGNPELIDALADVLEERGQAEEAARSRARAAAAFEVQLEQLPEAAYGHALEHFLSHGAPERSLALAEENHRLRPGGEATVRLAQALVRNGRPGDAWVRLEPLFETPYRTAELHATAARILRLNGDEARAAEQERLATAIHPGAVEDLDWLTPPH